MAICKRIQMSSCATENSVSAFSVKLRRHGRVLVLDYIDLNVNKTMYSDILRDVVVGYH